MIHVMAMAMASMEARPGGSQERRPVQDPQHGQL